MEGLVELIGQLGALGGFAALVAMLVNVLKSFGLIGDGHAGQVAVGLNLAGLVALFVVGQFAPGFDIGIFDQQLGQLAEILILIFAFVFQNFISNGTHGTLSGMRIPVIGKSN